MYDYVCPNRECREFGVERLFDYDGYVAEINQAAADNPEEEYDLTPHVYCGECGTEITENGHEVPDDYQPPVPQEITPEAEQQMIEAAQVELDAEKKQRLEQLTALLAQLRATGGSYQQADQPPQEQP